MATEIRMPNLRINHKVSLETARVIVSILMSMQDPATFTAARTPDGQVRIWMSKRTHDYLKTVLKGLC
jgi:hypothetical protein